MTAVSCLATVSDCWTYSTRGVQWNIGGTAFKGQAGGKKYTLYYSGTKTICIICPGHT